jgi:hypothetical protein
MHQLLCACGACFSLDFAPHSLYYNAMFDHGKAMTEEGRPWHLNHLG